MKILHLADLHFGKSLHAYSLIESGDQPDWAEKTLARIHAEKPKAVVIAGDVYDRGVPSREAVQLLDRFLTRIAKEEGIPVLLTAGNHDGGERLEFARNLLHDSGVYIAGTVSKEMVHLTLKDEYGPVNFWLMPYVFPAAVREALGLEDDAINSYTDAVRALLSAQPIDFSQRNVILAHQMVLHMGQEPEHSSSETVVGGIGGVDSAVFDGFDYVALGHIHGAQKVGDEHIRYAGAPLCYHFSEATQKKGLLFVNIGQKGSPLTFDTQKTEALHKVRPTMIGTFEEIMEMERQSQARNEFVRVELTDAVVPHEAREKLTAMFATHGCRLLDLVAAQRNVITFSSTIHHLEDLSPDEHFSAFYREQRSEDLSADDQVVIKVLAQQVMENAD
ncbi:MAG: exonuclease SbcCD subunit D, partial [Lachnospiraceae bacterium]|nr:exonuclease SbcCD subunit D [Candidatus Equihabitans merdae]